MLIQWIIMMTTLLLTGCAADLPSTSQPSSFMSLVDTTPLSDSILSRSDTTLSVTFDQTVLPSTVTDSSLFLASGYWTWSDFGSTAAIEKALRSQILIPVSGQLDQDADAITWHWRPTDAYEPNQIYTLILTPRIKSTTYIPLSADASHGTQAYFLHFYTSDRDGASTDSGTPEDSPDASVLTWSTLMLSEIYYDHEGDETDGALFIELYGTPGADIAHLQLLLVNGADGSITKTILLPEDARLTADGFYVIADAKTGESENSAVDTADYILNFDPQNGPDSIQLLESNSTWIDGVGYGDFTLTQAENTLPLFEETSAMEVVAGESLCRVEFIDRDINADDFVACTPTPGLANLATTLTEDPPKAEAPGTPLTAPPIVWISEVITDPQQDWNDSSGGNGIAFDTIVGTGTIGTTDEWIEFYNDSGTTLDLRGWQLEMIDSTPSVHVFTDPDPLLYGMPGSTVSAWAPDTFLILGNPEGDLKNEDLTLSLIDANEDAIDRWTIEDADATGIETEALDRRFSDDTHAWIVEQAPGSPWE